MQVTETLSEGLKREFKIVIGADEMSAKIDGRLSEVGQQVRLSGFRPGKVPLSVLKQRFGASVMGEVLDGTVKETTTKVMEERGLRPAMTPKVEVKSFDQGQDLEFEMGVEVLPEIENPDFSTLELERLKADISDADVEDGLERLAAAQNRTKLVEEERAARSGDVVVLDYDGKLDGAAFAGGASSGEQLQLGSGSFIPGFEEQVEGQKIGTPFQVTTTFPKDYHAQNLAGREAVFDCEIKELRAPDPAQVDDELARAVGFESLDELRQSVRDRFQRESGQTARARLKGEMLDKLAESYNFEVPEVLISGEFDQIWKQIEQEREHGGVEPADASKSDEDLKAEYRVIAERRVRLGLLLSDVGNRNDVKVGQEEVHRAIMEEARRYPGQEQQVVEYYRSNEQAQAALRAPLIEDKVVDFIAEMAQVTERSVSLQELIKLTEEETQVPEGAEKKASKTTSQRGKKTTKGARAKKEKRTQSKPRVEK